MVEIIGAECHSDDWVVEVKFNALEWFKNATDEEILSLASCGWGGDYASDAVAHFMEEKDEKVDDMFKYLKLASSQRYSPGFECNITDVYAALCWLKENRPDVLKTIHEEVVDVTVDGILGNI